MTKYFNTKIGRLRMFAFLEGLTLILLVFIAVPLKYLLDLPLLVEMIGPIHGALFILFVVTVVWIALEREWKFPRTACIIFLSSFVQFGTFYIDRKYFRNLE